MGIASHRYLQNPNPCRVCTRCVYSLSWWLSAVHCWSKLTRESSQLQCRETGWWDPASRIPRHKVLPMARSCSSICSSAQRDWVYAQLFCTLLARRTSTPSSGWNILWSLSELLLGRRMKRIDTHRCCLSNQTSRQRMEGLSLCSARLLAFGSLKAFLICDRPSGPAMEIKWSQKAPR